MKHSLDDLIAKKVSEELRDKLEYEFRTVRNGYLLNGHYLREVPNLRIEEPVGMTSDGEIRTHLQKCTIAQAIQAIKDAAFAVHFDALLMRELESFYNKVSKLE